MLTSFTRNYDDNSTDAGFQFTFHCDKCYSGYRSSFVESTNTAKGNTLKTLTRGIGVLGSLAGGKLGELGWAAERGGSILSERFNDRSAAWQKEHETAFIRANNEAQQHFHRCPACNNQVCDSCFNDEAGLCVDCAPNEGAYVARAKAEAMKRNIDEAGQNATVWKGAIEDRTTVCPVCGKPSGGGKFCNNCGASLEQNVCPNCGAKMSQGARFCNNCGSPMTAPKPADGKCPDCGFENAPGTRFCGGCGTKL